MIVDDSQRAGKQVQPESSTKKETYTVGQAKLYYLRTLHAQREYYETNKNTSNGKKNYFLYSQNVMTQQNISRIFSPKQDLTLRKIRYTRIKLSIVTDNYLDYKLCFLFPKN